MQDWILHLEIHTGICLRNSDRGEQMRGKEFLKRSSLISYWTELKMAWEYECFAWTRWISRQSIGKTPLACQVDVTHLWHIQCLLEDDFHKLQKTVGSGGSSASGLWLHYNRSKWIVCLRALPKDQATTQTARTACSCLSLGNKGKSGDNQLLKFGARYSLSDVKDTQQAVFLCR